MSEPESSSSISIPDTSSVSLALSSAVFSENGSQHTLPRFVPPIPSHGIRLVMDTPPEPQSEGPVLVPSREFVTVVSRDVTIQECHSSGDWSDGKSINSSSFGSVSGNIQMDDKPRHRRTTEQFMETDMEPSMRRSSQYRIDYEPPQSSKCCLLL